MKKYTEIEAKLKVDSLNDIEKKLKELNAEFVEERYQSDTHFDDAQNALMKSDSCLRLRRQEAREKTKYFMTYKGAKEKSSFKKRREIELEISDADSMEMLLAALGYKKVMVVEKKRRLYRLHGCEIAVDHLNRLGDFVEIEGPNEKVISDVQESLGLEHLEHILKSYASLIADKLMEMKKRG